MMKLKKRQYHELISILKMQAEVVEKYCLENLVTQETPYIKQNIQAAINHLGSAHDQLEALIKDNEGKCDD